MDVVLLIARLALAAVFAVAGLSKLGDQRGSRQAVEGFGLPAVLAGPVGLLLPLVELAIAVALILNATAWAASLAAAALLLLFIGAIGINLSRGRTPDCHCFGQLHSEPIGPGVLIRNGILLAVAAFVAVAGYGNPGTSATNWVDTLRAFEVAGLVVAVLLAAMVAGQWYLLLNVIRQNGRILTRLESLETQGPTPLEAQPSVPQIPVYGLPVGTPAPAFSLSGLHGETMTLDALRSRGNAVLLLFASPSCGPCNALLPDIAAWQRDANRFTTVVLSSGDAAAIRDKMSEYAIANVFLDENNAVAQSYKYPGTPSAVVVDPDGTLATPVSAGVDGIRGLVSERFGEMAAAQPIPQPVPAPAPAPIPPIAATRAGQDAPSFDLPDLTGRQIRLADYRGKDILLLFWNTGCGFCRRMLPDLQAWETQKPADGPEILVFSAGPIEEVRAMGLTSPVVHDQTSTVSNAYGASGTPMAVLVNRDGKIASGVAAGAEAVLQLAGREASPDQPSVESNGYRALNIGDPAPAIRLSDVDGKPVDLADFRGRDTLVLFWNTGCGFCQRMLPDLKAWEQTKQPASPDLLLVSSGPVDDIRAMGLQAPIGVDADFNVGPTYGANGTPMGVIVDASGNIASEMAAGADAVLALARSRESKPFSA